MGLVIHSTTLHLLIGACKPLIFKVIIDRYEYITILFFHYVLVLILIPNLICILILKASPLTFLVIQVWW